MKTLNYIFNNKKVILTLFFVVALFAAIKYTFLSHSNNYTIFYYSLKHLVAGESMYAAYPEVYHDHYLYAPAFAVVFAPIFLLPYKLGLFLWPFFFTGIWVFSVYKMPWTHNQKLFAWWYGIQELLTAIDNSQTNPLIAAIPLLAFVCFDKGKIFWAAFFIILGFNVKIYSLVTAALFVVYPGKLKFIASMVFWMIVFALIPLLTTSPSKLLWQYQLWVEQLFAKTDHDKSVNISIHRLVHQFISPSLSPTVIIGIGVGLFCTVFIHVKKYAHQYFRMLLLASILVFHVIFNPAAESATYITAITGVIVWWLFSPKQIIDWVLVIGCYLLTVMGPTDLYPVFVRKAIIEPFALKALPCVLIWFRILYLMHFYPTTKAVTSINKPLTDAQ